MIILVVLLFSVGPTNLKAHPSKNLNIVSTGKTTQILNSLETTTVPGHA